MQFGEFVANHLGLHFPVARQPDLQRGLHAAAREFGYDDDESCINWLMSAPLTQPQVEVLASNLTVGETYFFREKRTFEALEQQVLPELIRARQHGERRLRLWSAACCTGEEAYSLAILVRRLLPDLRDWNITILATDVNPRFLHKAVRGEFGGWSFRDAPARLQEDCFTRAGPNHYAILPAIKQMVTFKHLNLVQDAYPSLLNDTNAMDVILCRNVLMYFVPPQVQRVIEKLHLCLIENGWLILSASEVSPTSVAEFAKVPLDGCIFYRKGPKGTQPAPTFLIPPVNEPVPVPAMALLPEPLPVEPPPKAEINPSVEASPAPSHARELANEGRLAEALVCADRMVAADKLNPRAHYLRALILLEQGAPTEAAQALQRALYLDRDFVLAHFALGNLARTAGRLREADKHFENALHRLRRHAQDDILPEADGLTAGRLAEIIRATQAEEVTA
jgi:chemotaxis protein methyltransferase CheR